MAEERYRLVFYGEIAAGCDEETAKRNVGALFKIDAANVERMFSAGSAVLKNDIDYETAERFKAHFDKTGAYCYIEPAIPVTKAEPEPAPREEAPPRQSAPESMACPKCGFEQEKSDECARCGILIEKYRQSLNRPHDTETKPGSDALSPGSKVNDERTWATLCHLAALAGFILPLGNVLGPLVVWLLKKNGSAYVDEHGKVALNYQITVTLFLLLAIPVCFLGITAFILIPIAGILFLYTLVMIILSATKAYNGEHVQIRLSCTFLK